MDQRLDWCNPVLIKELRQGLREKSFALALLGLQAALVLLTAFSTTLSAKDAGVEGELFESVIAVILLGVMPVRGISAITNEVKQNTLEPILLTGVSARRLIAWKWVALVFETFLAATTVLPYVIVRYFLGGEEVIPSLEHLVLYVMGSALLSGLMVGFSVFRQRIAVYLMLVLLVDQIIKWISIWNVGSLSMPLWAVLAWEVLGLALVYGVVFDAAADSFSPMGQSHVFRRRILEGILLFLAVSLYLANGRVQGGTTDFLEALPSYLLLVIYPWWFCVVELSQERLLQPRHLRPFVRFFGLGKRFRGIGKVCAYFLVPGWPSGFLWFLVVFASYMFLQLTITLSYEYQLWDVEEIQAICGASAVAGFGSILIPAYFALLFGKNLRNAGTVILFINIAVFLVCHGFGKQPYWVFLGLFPNQATLGVMGQLGAGGFNTSLLQLYVWEGAFMDLVFFVLLALLAAPWLRRFNEAWDEAEMEFRSQPPRKVN